MPRESTFLLKGTFILTKICKVNPKALFTRPTATCVQAITSDEKSMYRHVKVYFGLLRLKLLHSCVALQVSTTIFGVHVQREWPLKVY